MSGHAPGRKTKITVVGMKTLYITIGLPGSGKSYAFNRFYRRPDVAYVSSDKIREKLFGSEYVQSDPDRVFAEFLREIKSKLEDDYTHAVYADATHICKDWRKQVLQLAKRLGVGDVRAVVFKPRVFRAWSQDRKRDRKVGLKVILNMAWRWEKPSIDEGFTSIEVLDYERIL